MLPTRQRTIKQTITQVKAGLLATLMICVPKRAASRPIKVNLTARPKNTAATNLYRAYPNADAAATTGVKGKGGGARHAISIASSALFLIFDFNRSSFLRFITFPSP